LQNSRNSETVVVVTTAVEVGLDPGEAAAGLGEAALRRALRGHGLRCTTQRIAVIELLADADGVGHLSAPDIFERLRERDQAMDLTTVYRTLATLVEVGLVHSVALPEQPAFYGLATPTHHHALCPRCARVAPIASDLLDPLLAQIAKLADLPLAGASLTVIGFCLSCQTAASSTEA
jgi:Fur family ferric uptake transcriptional regulator